MKKPVALRITAMIFIYIIAILYLVAVMFNPNLASIGGVAWFYLFLIVAIAVLVSIPKGISMLIGGILSGVFALLTLFSIISLLMVASVFSQLAPFGAIILGSFFVFLAATLTCIFSIVASVKYMRISKAMHSASQSGSIFQQNAYSNAQSQQQPGSAYTDFQQSIPVYHERPTNESVEKSASESYQQFFASSSPIADHSYQRPDMDRPAIQRPDINRPIVERPTFERPNFDLKSDIAPNSADISLDTAEDANFEQHGDDEDCPICPVCHIECRSGANFCPRCGTKLD